MVGRFTNRCTWREIVEFYRITEPYIAPVSNMEPRYNFAPLQSQDVLRLDKTGRREPRVMRWGLVPSWSKDDSGASKCINAKSETVATTKPSFRAAFKSRSCLVPADGFYEWPKLPGGGKQPYFITTKDGEPFAFAGLWEWWLSNDAPEGALGREAFTILTTEPNALCAPIHLRMPVMLAQDDWGPWLTGSHETRATLLRSFPAERMEHWPVSKDVGSVKNDRADLVERGA